MEWTPASVLGWLFGSEHGASGRLLPRWIFLRALGLIYYSVFFLAGVSNSRIDWAAGNSSGRRIPAGAGRAVRARQLLVCADAAVAIQRLPHGHGDLLGRHDCFGAAGLEYLAARYVNDMFRVFPFVRERGAGFFRLSVRWNVAGGGVYCAFFRASGIPAWMGRGKQAIARELVLAGVGRLPDLF